MHFTHLNSGVEEQYGQLYLLIGWTNKHNQGITLLKVYFQPSDEPFAISFNSDCFTFSIGRDKIGAKKKSHWRWSYSNGLLKMEPSADRSQCQTLAVNPNEQINSVSSEVSLLELSLSAPLDLAVCVCECLCASQTLLTYAFNLTAEGMEMCGGR